jgi:hypothetical protein
VQAAKLGDLTTIKTQTANKKNAKSNLYMERAFLSNLGQHLLTALSVSLTLYIGAHSVKTRHFLAFSVSCLSTAAPYTACHCHHGRAVQASTSDPENLYPARYIFPLTRKPSILDNFWLFLFSNFLRRAISFCGCGRHSRRYLGLLFLSKQIIISKTTGSVSAPLRGVSRVESFPALASSTGFFL